MRRKRGKNRQVRRNIFYNDEKYDGCGYKLQVESGEGQSDGDGFQDGGEVCYRKFNDDEEFDGSGYKVQVESEQGQSEGEADTEFKLNRKGPGIPPGKVFRQSLLLPGMDELEEELEAISQLEDSFEIKYAASITCIPEFTDISSYASSSEEEDDAIPNNEYEPVVADKRISQSSVKDDQNIAAREEVPGVLGSKSSRKRTKSNQKSKHPMLPPCNGKCTRFSKYISKDRRKEVYEGYWAKNELQRTEFISQRVTEYDKKTSRPRSSSKERNKSSTYIFKDDKAKVV